MSFTQEISKKPVITILGPTAVGKTDAAIDLYNQLGSNNAEIISVDSAMVYRGLDIGSGKPSCEILSSIPHGIVDIREPYEVYSVADFRNDCLHLIKEAHKQGKTPILVGGTMMYFNALFSGLNSMPGSSNIIRAKLYKIKEDSMSSTKNGIYGLYDLLVTTDPETARVIDKNDTQRIIRALEIYYLTGKTKSELTKDPVGESILVDYDVTNIILSPNGIGLGYSDEDKQSRVILHDRIAKRFFQMLEQGFIEEVESLYHNPLISVDLPAMKSCGYRQVWQYLSGEYTKDEMIERAIIVTRQLAKRQYTWLRKFMGGQKDIKFNYTIIDPKLIKIDKLY